MNSSHLSLKETEVLESSTIKMNAAGKLQRKKPITINITQLRRSAEFQTSKQMKKWKCDFHKTMEWKKSKIFYKQVRMGANKTWGQGSHLYTPPLNMPKTSPSRHFLPSEREGIGMFCRARFSFAFQKKMAAFGKNLALCLWGFGKFGVKMCLA